LSTIVIFPPLVMVSDIYSLQKGIEEEQMMMENMDRAMELMVRAVRGAGYERTQDSNHLQKIIFNPSTNGIVIKKDQQKLFDEITLIADVPDRLGHDCLGNPFAKERTREGKTFQRFYLEPNRYEPHTYILMCQGLDRHGRLQHGELLNHVNSLQIDWVKENSIGDQTNISQTPTGLIAITLEICYFSYRLLKNKPNTIKQTRYVVPRHLLISR
jgi:hypothetical protein